MKKIMSIMLGLIITMVMLSACGGGSSDTSKSESKSETPTQSQSESIVESITDAVTEGSTTEDVDVELNAGFVTFGLGGDFFQNLADAFVTKMNDAGWEASYADGKFNPTTQIEAFENYIAMGMDAIVIWSVAPEAMNAVVDQAMDQGIKVISFVAPTEKYDVLLLADNAELAGSCAKLAAQWIDEKFADQEDHSVPVAVFTDRTADTGVLQGDVLLKIEEFSKKAKFTIEVECGAEDVDTGMSKAETLYTSNPEIKVFLSAHNGLALGINNYFTSISSPVTDYSDIGIFTINGDVGVAELIKSSADDLAPLRGMVLTGDVNATAEEITAMLTGAIDGSIEKGHIQMADTVFVNVTSVDEFLSTGKVTSLTKDDFK